MFYRPLQTSRVTGNAGTPVATLAEAKDELHVLHNEFDSLIGRHLATAIAEIDGLNTISGRALGPQVWDVFTRVDAGETGVLLRIPDFVSLVGVFFIGGQVVELESAEASVVSSTEVVIRWDETVSPDFKLPEAPNLRVRCNVGANPIPPAAATAALLRTRQLFYEHKPQVETAWHRTLSSFRINASAA